MTGYLKTEIEIKMSDMFPLVSLRDVSRLDAASTVILSVNNRHARRIVSELSALLSTSQEVMAVPDIVPLGAWLVQAADHLSFQADHDMPSYMTDGFGTVYLWRRVINDAEPDQTLLDTGQAARLAFEADRLLDDWRITVRPDEETVDYQRFMMWRARYRSTLDELDIEDGNLAYERVCHAVADGTLQLPVRHIVLAGFNDISPRLASLLKTIEEHGTTLSILHQPSQTAHQIQRLQVSDSHAEWRLAAQWACEQLEQNPEGRYAIVAPKLEGSVPLAHRVLGQTLGQRGYVFNIAVGRPLAEWPLVRAAMAWLRVVARYIQRRPCVAADLGQALLAGGCVGHNEEASHRALLDAHLRRRGVVEWSETQFAAALAERVPRLGAAWPECMGIVNALPGTQSLAGWTHSIQRLLQALGFPGDTVLDSHAYQTLDALDQLIDRLGQQAPVAGEVGFSSAVSLLAQLAKETLFQPQRDPRSRLDVLGLLESEGGRWDGVWVLGLTDDVLPAVPQPNPLVPLAALRRVNAPRATPERELQWAHSIYSSLLACAPCIWLSHPVQEGERELRPSPCIAEIPAQAAEPQVDAWPEWPLEYVVDDKGPPLDTRDHVKGGIALIDAQARNPLWAFAKFRLGASAMSDYATLMDQSVRGQFLHRAMELLWSMLPSQKSLIELMNAGRLSDMIEQVTEQAADEWLVDGSSVLRELELQRARTIMLRWLALEAQREPFDVMAVEKRQSWAHGSLELSVQLDRIDCMADGRLAVMDYKTGASAPDPRKSWMRERPVDLQLPFYAAVLNHNDPGVAALIQAYLHSRKTDTAGISDGDCGLSGVSHFTSWDAFEGMSWAQVLSRWQAAIASVADEFSRGYAPNMTVDKADMMYCDVLPFLRLTEEHPNGG